MNRVIPPVNRRWARAVLRLLEPLPARDVAWLSEGMVYAHVEMLAYLALATGCVHSLGRAAHAR